MAKDLKKFVNPKFLKIIHLGLLKQLFSRQPPEARGVELAIFEGEDAEVRQRLKAFFEGPEEGMPRGLVADLHHIAELGSENGMHLLQERAAARDVEIVAPLDANGHPILLDPKHFALIVFLNHRAVFDVASDIQARQARSSLAEYVGLDEGVEPRITDGTKAAFEAAASELFQRDHRGAFCRVGWHEDGEQTVLVVTHGAPVTVGEVPKYGFGSDTGKVNYLKGRCVQPTMYYNGRLNLSISFDGGMTYDWRTEFNVGKWLGFLFAVFGSGDLFFSREERNVQ